MESVRILVVCENRAHLPSGIMGEHGFSALVQTPGNTFLMDTGQGLALGHNAKALKIDLARLDHIVLSHGHYDHTGGLGQLPARPEDPEARLPIHAHPDVLSEKYLQPAPGDSPVFIGIPFSREEIEQRLNARFEFHCGFSKLTDQVGFCCQIPRKTGFEQPDPRLLIKTRDGFKIDPFLDDGALVIETDSGPVILAGCAHAGIVNIMSYVSEMTGHTSIYGVIGGTHLDFAAGTGRLEETMDAFERFDVRLIAVSHCTGNKAAAILFNRFKDRFAFAGAGWQVDL